MAKENPKSKGQGSAKVSADQRIHYRIDAAQSELIVHTGTSGLFGGLGHKLNILAKELSGEIAFSPEDFSRSSLEIQVKSASLAVIDRLSEKDKAEIEASMKGKVLAIEDFPQIAFKSSRVTADRVQENEFKAQIEGDFTLHGETHPLTIPATIHLKGKTLEAEGEFPINQKEFGIKPFSAAGGTIKVKNELKITFRITALL